MDVETAIVKRRAYRSLEPVVVDEELVKVLGTAASLAPSCFNNQPWRFVFVYEPDVLQQVKAALTSGNRWAQAASLIIAVFSRKDLDCIIKGREYYLFDVGMATAFMLLRATELGLVAHPIAGFDEVRVKEVLNVPEDMTVITLVIVGRHADRPSPLLSEKQIEAESRRPERLPLDRIVYRQRFA